MLNRHILEKPNKEYIEAMKQADFILPDGIALKLFLKKHNIKISENLN
jgi:UDP-N-acetyl-D-mannosaminuronic acid transferase (WecB/TagA/CpsF family)